MKFTKWICLLLVIVATPAKAQVFKVLSPDKQVELTVTNASVLSYAVRYHGKLATDASFLGLTFETGEKWGYGDKILAHKVSRVNQKVKLVTGNYKEITDSYTSLKLTFDKKYSIIFRIFDQGVAYRFEANRLAKDSICVTDEKADFRLSDDPSVVMAETNNLTAWELSHQNYSSVSTIEKGHYGITPMFFNNRKQGFKVVIAESDLNQYPGMYLKKQDSGMCGYWALYPKEIGMGSWGNFVTVVKSRTNMIARTPGNQSFPWRILILAEDDRALLANNMIFLLAKPQQLKNTTWIKSGKAAWEWWHCAILEKAPFESGHEHLSTQLYKYYIDFASENKLEYLLIDAGWSNLFRPNELNPNVDVKEIIRYGKEKKVGVFLWTVASTLMKYPHKYLDSISSWGAAGVKIDFFDRDDAQMIPQYEELAKACAERKLLVDFHGCSKPTGLHRAYPNILTYEAVRGMECSKWDTSTNPNYRLQFIFSRMLAGPIDYTPGSMRNSNLAKFKPIDPGLPMSLGTRCQDLAEYVVINSSFVMLADSPDEYRKYPDILKYLSDVPATWDNTKILAASYGEYALVAKQHGAEWFLGGMTNWNERTVTLNFSFLPRGKKYTAEIFRDAENANDQAGAYLHEFRTVDSSSNFEVYMAKGGGIAIHLTPASK
ncbi:MAG TPA: glycoside hydrolase family 97 protein [Bacteroidales bacterium]|nr:glycoside hydrolase family 97 protein [Bacteroidales bacterium]